VIVQASLSIGTVVIGVAALGFLGLGFGTSTPEWGTMLNAERNTLSPGPGGEIYWWVTVFPGLAIFLFVMSMNLIGDGINDALDAQEDATTTQGAGG
jgi:peptide/nickel transport system permease protein